MTGSSHLLLGTAVGITAAMSCCENIISVPGLCVVGGCVVGSLFPDIDSGTSKISCRMPVLSFFIRILFGHRNLLHTPFVLILFGILFSIIHFTFALPGTFILGFALGYVCHLLQDGVTKRGIMWFYPVSHKYRSFIGIVSGRSIFVEFVLSMGIYGIVVAVLSAGNTFISLF